MQPSSEPGPRRLVTSGHTEAVVAIGVYALVAWGLAKLAWLLVGETRSGVRTRSRTVDTDSR